MSSGAKRCSCVSLASNMTPDALQKRQGVDRYGEREGELSAFRHDESHFTDKASINNDGGAAVQSMQDHDAFAT